jgi:hypothetical protein
MSIDIIGGILKDQLKKNLPAIIEELKKELPKIFAENKDRIPELVAFIRTEAEAELAKLDFDDNHIADIDEYKDDIDEIAGHLHAIGEVGKRIETRALAMKNKLMPAKEETENAKDTP